LYFIRLRRKPQALRPWTNAGKAPYEAHEERSGVCFGGVRPSKQMEERWALAKKAPLFIGLLKYFKKKFTPLEIPVVATRNRVGHYF